MPSIFPIALASNPPKAPASTVERKKNVKRFCDSSRLYHIATATNQHVSGRLLLCSVLTEIEASGEDARLEGTKEEPSHKKATVIRYESLSQRDNAEHSHADSEVEVGFEDFKERI